MEKDSLNGLKQAMRVYPQGVTVATTTGPSGPTGLTVSSFTSVSLDPPLILISIAKGSAIHDLFCEAKAYAVNFLADDQKSVSDRFAGRTGARDRFEGLRFIRGVTGSPIIEGARVAIECKPWQVYEGGDHSILVGEVVAAKTFNSKRPLVYYSQQYTTTEQTEYPAPPSDMVW
ncbi:MAG TPA: flavin reductase family protein [Nitrososphaerales archaeon]|nr:flavin reductase family protein [Nitrososphaerales archaeon]